MSNSITNDPNNQNESSSEINQPDTFSVLPDEDTQQDLFLIPADDDGNWPVKNDITLMEFPIFSLSKNKDLEVRTFSRGGKYIKVIPSVMGAATEFDKDLLIYVISQLVKGFGENKGTSKKIRFKTRGFLTKTKKSTGGAAYVRLLATCQRLRGTTIETNVKTTDYERTRGFGLLENYDVISYTKNGKGALELEIVISDWLYRSIAEFAVLTLNPAYFELTAPLERRLYELARKHCGDKAYFKINVDLLQEKIGSTQQKKSFMNDLRHSSKINQLPDYRLLLDESTKPAQAVFVTKDNRKLFTELKKQDNWQWYQDLLTAADAFPRKAEKH